MLKADPKNAFALRFRGAAYIDEGLYKQGIEDETASLAIAPTALAYQLRGEAHFLTGDNSAAISDEQAALRLDSTSPLAWEIIGDAKKATGDLSGAANAYLASLQRDACNASVADKLKGLSPQPGIDTTLPPCNSDKGDHAGPTRLDRSYDDIYDAELIRFVGGNPTSNVAHGSRQPHTTATPPPYGLPSAANEWRQPVAPSPTLPPLPTQQPKQGQGPGGS